MLSEYSELGKIEKYQQQSTKTWRYVYDTSYYLLGLACAPVLILFSYTTYVAVMEGKLGGILLSSVYLLFTLLLVISFATSVICTQEGITVKFTFLFSRSMKWNDVKRMRLRVGNVPTCRIYSKGFSLPITFNLTPPGKLTDKITLLATIKTRAKLSNKKIKNNNVILFFSEFDKS